MLQLQNRYPYNPNLKNRVRYLRKNMTQPEKKLWYEYLRVIANETPPQSPSIEGEASETSRGRKLRVYKQRPIGHFIVDFYIPNCKLVIEIDGESHFTQE